MRFAVLLTGHPRTFEQTYKSLYDNCIQPNGADVFLSVWSEDETGKSVDINRLQQVYNPIKIDVSSVIDYEVNKDKFVFVNRTFDCFQTNIRAYISKQTNGIKQIERIRSQWYRVKRGIDTIAATGKYDAILRMRFDIGLNSRIDISKISLQKSGCYIPKLLESVEKDHFVSCGLTTPVMTDHWCYGPWESMLKYGSIYDQLLPMYYDENVPISNAEEMFAYFMLTRVGTEHYIDSLNYDLIR